MTSPNGAGAFDIDAAWLDVNRIGLLAGTRQIQSLQARRDVLRTVRQIERAETGKALRFTLRLASELRAMEPPQPLVEDVFPCGALGVVSGPPGVGKTFLLEDWAFSIQAGTAWFGGRKVAQGPVVYVLGEGAAGLGPRIDAWSDYHLQGRVPDVLFLTEPVRLREASEVAQFVDAVLAATDGPRLIVFDTLARMIAGGDENGTDMAVLIEGADRVRTETGAAVVLAHHLNATGERERGRTDLKGAVDTALELRRSEDGTLKLSCVKQKDSAPFDDIYLQLTPHLRSVVLTRSRELHGVDGSTLRPGEAQTLRALHAMALEDGVSATAWKDASGLPGSTFYKYQKSLVGNGFAETKTVRGFKRYVVTLKGERLLTP